MRFTDRNAEERAGRGADLLVHYFRTIAGASWDPDMESEVRLAVDMIVSAAVREASTRALGG